MSKSELAKYFANKKKESEADARSRISNMSKNGFKNKLLQKVDDGQAIQEHYLEQSAPELEDLEAGDLDNKDLGAE